MRMNEWNWIVIIWTVVAVNTKLALLYPENGMHVELQAIIETSPSQWTQLSGWGMTQQKSGLFQEGVSISKSAVSIGIEKGGLYYLSLYLRFDQPEMGMFVVNVTSDNGKAYVSKSQGTLKQTGIVLNEMVMLDEGVLLVAYVYSDKQISISRDSSFVLQHLSTYEHYVGFIANPKQSTTVASRHPQFLVNWNREFSFHHGFSTTTGTFMPLYDGYYLVNVKFVLENVKGRIQCILSNDRHHYMFDEYYTQMMDYVTLSFSNVFKFKTKQNVFLKIRTESARVIVHNISSYSIVMMKEARDDIDLGYTEDNFLEYNLEDDDIFDGDSNQLQKIKTWRTNDTNFIRDGNFHIPEGYYFVALKILAKTVSPSHWNNVELEMNVDRSRFPLIHRPTIQGCAGIFHGVVFLRKGGFLSCLLKTKSRIELLESTSFVLYKLKLQVYSSLYALDGSSILPSSNSFINLQEIHIVDYNAVTSSSSSNAFAITIQKSGLYDLVVNLHLTNGTGTAQVSLMRQTKEMAEEKWEEITKCVSSSNYKCFLSIAINSTEGDELALRTDSSEYFTSANSLIPSSSSIQITYLIPTNNIIGFSTYTQKSDSTMSGQKLVFLPALLNGPIFLNKVNYTVNKITIEVKGYYALSCNTLVHLLKPIRSKSTVVVLLRTDTKSTGRKTKTVYETIDSNVTLNQLSVIGGFNFDIDDTFEMSISVKNNKGKQVAWHSGNKSVMSLVLISKDATRYFQVDGDTYILTKTGGNIFKTLHQDDKTYFDYYYNLKATRTSTIMIRITLVGTAIVNTQDTSDAGEEMRINILLNDKETLPHFFSTVRKDLKNNDKFTMHISGVMAVHAQDLIKVNIKLSSKLDFRISSGTTLTVFILDNEMKSIADSSVFQPMDVQIDQKILESADSDIERSGVYVIMLKIMDTLATSGKREKRSSFGETKQADIKVSYVTEMQSKTSTKESNNGSPPTLKPIQVISNDPIFDIQCSNCTDQVFLAYAKLMKGSYPKIISTNSNQNTYLGHRYIGSDLSMNELTITQDVRQCASEGYDFIDRWQCSGVVESCITQIGFYRAPITAVVILNMNIFVETENDKGFLQLQGHPVQTQNLKKVELGNHRYHFHLTKQMLIKQNEVLKLGMHCGNDTVVITKNSKITVVVKESFPSKVADEFPVFTVDPVPEMTVEPYEFNYTCSTDGFYDNVTYQWNKVDLNTGIHYPNLSSKKYYSVDGLPEESGHYFCVANHNGYETQSYAATLHIQDDDECYLLRNHSLRQHLNISIIPCHENAECQNTIGSYSCKCKPGFAGNGFHCTDINECEDTYICGNHSTCFNNVGGYNCSCNVGFKGENGTNCTDIDECEFGDDLCFKKRQSTKTYCINTIGSFVCPCKDGYHAKEGRCIDINECHQKEYPCDANANCVNTDGSYYCQCYQGWEGNGTLCEDIDECLNETLFQCALNSSCHNNNGSYRCRCDHGFKGDGKRECQPLGCFPPKYCTGQYLVSWWRRAPYIEQSPLHNDHADGLFYAILRMLIQDICRNCSEVYFEPPSNGSMEVENKVEASQTDFGCPLYGSREQEQFRGYPFIPIVESSGVAFFVKEVTRNSSPLISSLTGSWPILIITLILASLSGIIVWFLDNIRNPDEFPSTFIQGSWEGFWWAFITMTTVGYGDKAPRSFGARLFGVLWILVGLVIMSTFTATITTVLTTTSLTSQTKLYGTKVGALANSEEFRLGVKRNANIKGYNSVSEIIDAMDSNDIQGALIDSYIAGEFQKDLERYKLQEVLEHTFVYGVVLSRDAIRLEHALREHIERRQSDIYNVIAKAIKPLTHNRGAKELISSSSGVFDATSPIFKKMLMMGAICLCSLIVIGMFCDWFWRQKRRYKKKDVKTKDYSLLSQPSNGTASMNIIESQRRAYKNEIAALRLQIVTFSNTWVKRLNELESTHEKELGKVHNWLTKTKYIKNNNTQYGRSIAARIFNSGNHTSSV